MVPSYSIGTKSVAKPFCTKFLLYPDLISKLFSDIKVSLYLVSASFPLISAPFLANFICSISLIHSNKDCASFKKRRLIQGQTRRNISPKR